MWNFSDIKPLVLTSGAPGVWLDSETGSQGSGTVTEVSQALGLDPSSARSELETLPRCER